MKPIHYIKIIKPKIILGNILSVIGGFFIAPQDEINYNLLLKTLIGISFIIASNCILNNIIDYPVDLLMQRTKDRALILRLITIKHAFIYAAILICFGFTILLYETNLRVIYLAIIGSITYIGMYSFWFKKKSVYSTLIGSLSGSTPPTIGYCAVTNQFDTGAFILTILFITWQIPHFYSIAIFRYTDYQSARIPTYPSKKGVIKTKQHMISCIIIFMICILILTFTHCLSYIFSMFMEVLTGYWLYIAYTGNQKNSINDKISILWAKKIFILSIIIIILFNITISIDATYSPKHFLNKILNNYFLY